MAWVEANISAETFWPILGGLMIGVFAPVVLAAFSAKARHSLVKQMDALTFFLPQNASERLWFVGVSIAGAVLLAALVFGVDHGYQGWWGILSTGAMALLLTVIFVMSGSLWIPMIIHALIDLRVVALLSLAAANKPRENV